MIAGGRHTIVPDDIDCNVDLAIGSFCSIASGLKIISGQHPGVEHRMAVSNFPFFEHNWGDYPPSKHDGIVVIENDVWIGQDVSILDGVTVGSGSVVAACSVVTKDVQPYSVVAGNPARCKKFRFTSMVREELMRHRWWMWPDEKIKEFLPLMADVYDFTNRMEGRS